MSKIDILLTKIEKLILNTLLLSVTFVLFFNVVLRLMGNSFQWAEEFARYGIVWVTFIGASACVYKGAHIGVDAITMILNPRSRRILSLITVIISIVFIVIFTHQSFLITKRAYLMGQVSSTLKVSMIYIYGAMPVGGILMLFRLAQDFIRQFKLLISSSEEVSQK